MKYVIIGAGGTGGILGFYMTKAGKDVTLIARNAHLAADERSKDLLSAISGMERRRQSRSKRRTWRLMRA